MINCPLCNELMDVDEDDLDEGDALTCEQCGANLSVSSVSPLELTPDKEDEDFEEDEEYEEEFDDEDEEDEDEEDEEE